MRNGQAGLLDHLIAVEEDVQVDRPGPPTLLARAVPAELPLDLEQLLEESSRTQIGLELRDGVHEARLLGDSHRIGLPERGDAQRAELSQQLERGPQVLLPVAEVGAEADVGDSHGAVVRLVEITPENTAGVARLRVSARQEAYVANVAESLQEAVASPEAGPWYRAVFVDDTPVGFVMLGISAESRDERYPFRYFLWRLLIDERFQGRGYGAETIDCVVAEIRKHPDADALFTSVAPGSDSPIRFYEKYGFVRTGQIFDDEVVLRLDLMRDREGSARATRAS
jgi:diamine N-acetyltransferase